MLDGASEVDKDQSRARVVKVERVRFAIWSVLALFRGLYSDGQHSWNQLFINRFTII